MDCPRCQHANRDGARFCGECGEALTAAIACPRCAALQAAPQRFCDSCGEPLATDGTPRRGRSLRAYTPRHLADKVLQSRSALEGERKQVTVLFADMVDSMLLAERVDAEEWHRVLDGFFQILAEEVHRFEGTINQFTGDGIMALFGAPVAHEDHARRACHAALGLVAALRTYSRRLAPRGLEFSIRVGLNSGEVVVGKIGDDLRMDYTAQGHSVGLAARTQQLAAPGTVWLTEHTTRLVEGFFSVRERGTATMKGVSAPVSVYELEGLGPLRTRLDASGARGFSRLVGREAELDWLEAILARTSESHGQVVGVVADAGVGKSRLCLEFVDRCRARGVAVHEAHCPSHGATVPLLPIRELLRSVLDLAEGEPAEEVRRKAEERLLGLGGGFRNFLPIVLEVLGVAEPGKPVGASFPDRLADFLRRFVRATIPREPVLVLLDDAHWIDRASDEIVRELIAALPGTRTMFVANFRPEYRPEWAAGAYYHQLPLSPLGEQASRELLRDQLGTDPSVVGLAERIRERTGGNPFFIEEIVHALAIAGNLVGRRGEYRLAADLDALVLPVTVKSLLTARVDRLGERAKQVLQAASVIGKQFDEALLAEVSGLGGDDLATALRTLQQAEFVHRLTASVEPQYAFQHPLTREAAYQSQLGEPRARLHARVAAVLEKLRGDRLGEYASLIAHHWESSGMRFEAARWQRRAALHVSNIKLKVKRSRRIERR
jgi:class 3 adenylate cyclase